MIIFAILFAIAIAIMVYALASKTVLEDVSLPSAMKGEDHSVSRSKDILDFTAKFTNKFIEKSDPTVMEKLKRKLVSSGKRMTVSQFVAFKFLAITGFCFIVFSVFKPPLYILVFPLIAGYLLPELWLNGEIKKRKRAALRDLPYIIDLLNICVGAGLDFMVAVNHVIKEFRPCVMVDELKTMVKEMQMGLSRRESLKNLGKRISSQEINSFVRTLLQADRMGAPITVALKMHSEELRMIRFQKGEEMALKAPIKLLIPLIFFILPVVIAIVAGPVLIKFMQGGGVAF